jgi:hypothetical protein
MILLNTQSKTNDLLNNVCYSKISSSTYKEVEKRVKLWNIGKEPIPVKNGQFKQFIEFINNASGFLKIRETPELFQNMNEFYNLLQK